MQDRDVVAAIVTGDPDAIAEAYDRHAASLYAYCHSMLPGPEAAAEAVLDTFIVAVSKLGGLRDPDRLDAWLHTVARNECLRQRGPGYIAGAGSKVPGPAYPDDVLPAITLPAGLRGRVLTACADNSPTGRAHRMSVAHRAGPFGPAGFPKAIAPAGPRWWQRVRRHPGVAAAAVTAVVAAAAGITVIMTATGSNRPQAAAFGLGTGVSGASSSATSASVIPASATPASSPAHQAAPSASPPVPTVPTVTVPGGAPSPGPPTGRGTPQPPATPAPPSASPAPSASPSQGYLLVAPGKLMLTPAKGEKPRGFFVLTTVGGPVSHYTISVPAAMAGKVTVSPSMGSLPAGGYVTVTVTVISNAALNTTITVEPGNLTVQVMLKIKD